ncbi:hypothetical protein [Microvirga antarctica]|uniref:hypothetical protein n=1 Tax=Microvirga antarctica TaxID=2819233 RepID=UPI001FEC44AC|nr:hypothetical protein [Microvirga antarctica]
MGALAKWEFTVIGWVLRVLMIGASALTGWVMAKDAPLFGVVQILVTLGLMAMIVAVVAFWPAHFSERLSRLFGRVR